MYVATYVIELIGVSFNKLQQQEKDFFLLSIDMMSQFFP